MIFTHMFWVGKFKEIRISFVTCTVDLVGQGRLTIIMVISISVIRRARKIVLQKMCKTLLLSRSNVTFINTFFLVLFPSDSTSNL